MENYKEKDIKYVRNEAKTLYDSMFSDDEVVEAKKHVYAMIYNNMEMIFGCQIGGFSELEITKTEIKSIIKEVVDTDARQLNYLK
ncbi:hypothetical protein [uncultured Clostridium sp.]|uniref:hypothetical protein n=1 Tax=uncultured Clostridium sp. TaxID=59620 RepID=UPI002611B06B|nr:hypothetical protein [uncultured Clostridium sp.]